MKYVLLHDEVSGDMQTLTLGDDAQVVSAHPIHIEADTTEELLRKTTSINLTDKAPLPQVGEEVFKDRIYTYESNLVICRQTHIRTIDAPINVPALFATYQRPAEKLEWVVGEWVNAGDIRIYGLATYTAIQGHQTQELWNPIRTTGVLWKVVSDSISEWVQPTGAHDAYDLGAQVTHNGFTWESDYAANVWEPGVFGWHQI